MFERLEKGKDICKSWTVGMDSSNRFSVCNLSHEIIQNDKTKIISIDRLWCDLEELRLAKEGEKTLRRSVTARSHALQGAIGMCDRMCPLHQSTSTAWETSQFEIFIASPVPTARWEPRSVPDLASSEACCIAQLCLAWLFHRSCLSFMRWIVMNPYESIWIHMNPYESILNPYWIHCNAQIMWHLWHIQGVDLFGWRLIQMPNEPHCLQPYRTFIHFHPFSSCIQSEIGESLCSETSKFGPGTTPTKSRPSIIILKNQI